MMTSVKSRPLTAAQKPYFKWLKTPALKTLCDALERHREGSVRFVGGCVRDSLLGHPCADIDLATSIHPDAVMEVLGAAGFTMVPTGIDHGTVSAILPAGAVEITTLRRDVSTDGRRATIAYTDDWEIDATRRDFRINALYLSPGGVLFDPVGGLEDIAARRVRFIGVGEARIAEDYLRILRFFRFSARFSDGFDPAGLGAIATSTEGIAGLSRERIGSEFLKILALPRAAGAIEAMIQSDVLAEIWPAAPDPGVLKVFRKLHPAGTPVAALAALFGDGLGDIKDGIGVRLRLSGKQAAHLYGCHRAAAQLALISTRSDACDALYRLGAEVWRDAIALASARDPVAGRTLLRFIDLPDQWPVPVFPLSGRDVLDLGLAPGPQIAQVLRASEAQWIAAGYPGKEQALALMQGVLAAKK